MKKSLSFARFDAVLDTDTCDAYNNAELTLTLKMGFRQINPPAGAATGTYHDYGKATAPTRKIIKWTAGSWSSWKTNFVQSAERFWNGKFWLINDSGSFPFVKGSATYYPNVWCRFKLVGNEATVAGNHHTIDVVRLDPSETWFGSHSKLYDSLDTNAVQKATTSAGKKVMQQAHVHEVGHLLGMDHVDVGKPHCLPSGDTNAGACYGVADVDMTSVMGSGMTIREENAFPWRESLRHFALFDIVTTITNPLGSLIAGGSLSLPIQSLSSTWPAKMQRHYPRTADEVKQGKMITIRPQRPQ